MHFVISSAVSKAVSSEVSCVISANSPLGSATEVAELEEIDRTAANSCKTHLINSSWLETLEAIYGLVHRMTIVMEGAYTLFV
jgi:hypothetical protein